MGFMAAYFSSLVTGTSPISSAARFIRLSRRSSSSTGTNIALAFKCLTDGHQDSAQAVNRLLALLVNGVYPGEIEARVLSLCSVSEGTGAVEFGRFRAAVEAALLLEEVFRKAEVLYTCCVVRAGAEIDDNLVHAVLRQMDGGAGAGRALTEAEMAIKLARDAEEMAKTRKVEPVSITEFTVMVMEKVMAGRGQQ
jgi:hypothetical protein